jgi:hypothetical protein
MSPPASPLDPAAVDAVFAGIERGPRELVTLTDAQLVAADGAQARRVVPLLSLSGRAPETLVATAEEREQLDDPDVSTVLRLRHAWSGLLAFEQVTAVSKEFLALYLRPDRRTLSEYAREDGTHRFVALTNAEALDAMVDLLIPIGPDAADAPDGAPRAYTAQEWVDDGGESVAGARAVSVVIGLRRYLGDDGAEHIGDQRLTVYTFPHRAEVLLPHGGDAMTVEPTSRAQLREHLMNLLSVSRTPSD